MNASGGYVYLLHGPSTFERDEVVRRLKERMRAPPAGEHNLTEITEGEATLASVRAAADAMPFLADRRCVIVTGLLGRLQGKSGGGRTKRRSKASESKGPDEMAQLLDYLRTIPDTASIAFVEGAGIDPTAVTAAVPSGRLIVKEFRAVEDVARWVRQRAKSAGVQLDESAVRELVLLGGDDLRRLDHEVQKLGAYADGALMTREDVQRLVVARDTIIWGLLDALAERRRERALTALRRLYEQGESAEALLGRDLAPFYRRLLIARELSILPASARASVDVNALGLNPRTLGRTQAQASRFEVAELERALDLLLTLDRMIKTGEIEPDVGLELTLVRLCSRLSEGVAA